MSEVSRCKYYPETQTVLECGHGECRQDGQWARCPECRMQFQHKTDCQFGRGIRPDDQIHGLSQMLTQEFWDRTAPDAFQHVVRQMVQKVRDGIAKIGAEPIGLPDIMVKVRWRATKPAPGKEEEEEKPDVSG